MKPHDYKSRKAKKKALNLGHTGHEGKMTAHAMVPRTFGNIVKNLKKAFGISKYRNARIARFQARQRSKR